MKKILKNKGFTLIELLAVIVILAVIALIATPIVIGIIEDSKLKAQENSAYGIIDSAKYYYTQGLLKPENTIKYNENIVDELSYNGEHPKPGSWTSVDKEGNVGIALLYGNKCFLKEYSESKIKEGDKDNCKITIPSDTLTLKDTLIKPENLVTSGNGLYKISDTEYRYRGGCTLQGRPGSYTCADVYPINNYVSIGGQKYRIISVDSQGVKVMSEKKLATNMAFDARTSSTEGPRNNASNTFCQVTSGSYYGCSVYAAVSGTFTAGGKTGTVTQNSTLYDYLNTTGTDAEVKNLRDKALSTTWNIGAVTTAANVPLSTITTQEQAYKATFKMGLINTSDYINGSLDTNCQTDPLSYSANSEACRNNNWLFDSTSSYPWTLNLWTNTAGYSSSVWLVSSNNGSLGDDGAFYSYGVRPVGYLSSDILIKTGDGTIANPWIIE